tara:strand:+ start:177 stop:434 length:258 start_codon:yes stop_codon:yes gene_type:complete
MPSDQKLFCITEQQLEEMQDGIDMQKMSAYDKCNEDIKTMELAKTGLDLFMKRFGKDNRLYETFDKLIVELDDNIKQTQNHMDML